ncbi:acetyl-CoA carboxylase, biotin carboxyl carrier protein [Thermocrinis albus DSM 14484]|uniref:Biotin carboxyl carrier protein of acetyl-CoA carboxylase n=1 Tax=Thermocrinis albus (strain DSM 14484 / JCM 11386 / HI 11/12) TaxID=638303 RepID=D3SN33_THEAH|nr:acetyl-CoA carboxylase biotin carboxyl carrier protein [Thermocrinis albus]ADC90163.1 acetyl-CoA carboxylase, biotin carboxyl carrier protein [Thermocrinis albus DSM 14484]
MDKDFVKEIIQLISKSNIKSFSLEAEGIKIHIETNVTESSPREQPVREPRHQELLPPSEEVHEDTSHLHVIKSPLVGTFYRSPSPGAPPFVEVGDMVSPGQVLCIIEALKVMNEIESDVRGRVVKILVENGETVEYGQPLFIIDTSV